jgi:hypothetical protein
MSLHLSGFTPSGFRDVRRQEVSHLGFPGAETPKHQTLTCFTISGFPPSGFRDVRRQEVSHLGFPGAETPKHQTLTCFTISGIHPSGFRESGVSRLANTWGPHLGTPGAEIPKYDNFSTLYLSGYRKSGFRDLRVQGISPLDIPDAEKHRNIKLKSMLDHFGISLIGISGLASTRKFTLRCPGYRNTEKS